MGRHPKEILAGGNAAAQSSGDETERDTLHGVAGSTSRVSACLGEGMLERMATDSGFGVVLEATEQKAEFYSTWAMDQGGPQPWVMALGPRPGPWAIAMAQGLGHGPGPGPWARAAAQGQGPGPWP